jgi:hypothetical protein
VRSKRCQPRSRTIEAPSSPIPSLHISKKNIIATFLPNPHQSKNLHRCRLGFSPAGTCILLSLLGRHRGSCRSFSLSKIGTSGRWSDTPVFMPEQQEAGTSGTLWELFPRQDPSPSLLNGQDVEEDTTARRDYGSRTWLLMEAAASWRRRPSKVSWCGWTCSCRPSQFPPQLLLCFIAARFSSRKRFFP